MLKKPDDFKSITFLTIVFLTGIAMIFIPLIQQHQEIEADNSIYAMIAEEIRNQQAAVPDLPDASPVPEEAPAPVETSNSDVSDTAPPEQVPETDDLTIDPLDMSEVLVSETEKPGSPDPELPGMIIQEPTLPEATAIPAPEAKAPPPEVSALPSPTKAPAAEETDSPVSQNPDYVAWISIPGTVIDYPVVQSDRTEYYLHHLITGQQSKLGCLFSLTTSDYETPSKNIAIYGHHLSNSTAMFSTLINYKKEDYWRTHQTIRLNTLYGTHTYRIFAVLNHMVSDWDASTASFKSDQAFLNFVNRARKKAFYDTGVPVTEDDHILTLITCDRSFGGVQGRLLVMGVEQ